MGLGRLVPQAQHRSVPVSGGTRYEEYDLATGEHRNTYKIFGDLAPDWPTSSYRGGMSIPGGWRASLLLSGLLAGVPWNAFRPPVGNDPSPRMVTPAPPLLQQPNPPETRFTSFRSMALDYLWHGNGIGIYAARNQQGWPTAVIPVPALAVGIRRVDERNYPIPVGELEYLIGDMRFGARDVLHFEGPRAPGELRGMGVLEAHMRTIDGAAALGIEAHSPKGIPTGVLKNEGPDLTGREARRLKAKWMEAQRTRTVAVLNAGTTFEALAWNPEQSQLIEARKFTLTDFENIFGLPIGWLGGNTSSKTYSNVESDAINLLKFSLNDHLVQWQETLSQAFPRGTTVEPDLTAILRSDTVARYGAYNVATGGKAWLLPSEVRAAERYPAVEGIDDATTPAPPEGPAGAPNTPDDNSAEPIEGIEETS